MITGVLLAAGRGERFGSDKLLHALPDGKLVAAAAAAHLRPAVNRVLAVVRPEAQELAKVLTDEGAVIVPCARANAGMAHSIVCGVSASSGAHGWLVALADMPFIQTGTHAAVAERVRAGMGIVTPVYRGQRGHPVGWGSRFRSELLSLTGDRGGGPVLERHVPHVDQLVVEDPGVVWDIDHPEDIPQD